MGSHLGNPRWQWEIHHLQMIFALNALHREFSSATFDYQRVSILIGEMMINDFWALITFFPNQHDISYKSLNNLMRLFL